MYFDDYTIVEADMVFNGVDNRWFADYNNSFSADNFVEAVALHEFGHFIGLQHSPLGAATMFSRTGAGVGLAVGLCALQAAVEPWGPSVVSAMAVTWSRVFGGGGAGLPRARCHGKDGQGGTEGAVNNPAFLELISDPALRRIIITGRDALGMPNYLGLVEKSSQKQPPTSQDISDIVALMGTWRTAPARRLANQEKQEAPAPKATPTAPAATQPTGTTP